MSFGRFLELMKETSITGECSWRKDVFNDKIGNIEIDTCFAPDVRKWETGIDKGEGFRVVERYENRKLAEIGHKKWIEEIKKNPELDIQKIQDEDYSAEDWFFGE